MIRLPRGEGSVIGPLQPGGHWPVNFSCLAAGAHGGGGGALASPNINPAPCYRTAAPGRPPALVETKGAAGLLGRRHCSWLG
jgi:hypothetical protein